MRVLILIFAFRYRRAMIENKNGGFINSISSKIVNVFNIDETRDDFDLRKLV